MPNFVGNIALSFQTGQPPQSNTGGDLDLIFHTFAEPVAPFYVGVEIDWTNSLFDAAVPVAADDRHDAAQDLLIFHEILNEAGNWVHPNNLRPEWRKKNKAQGGFVSHVFGTAGVYGWRATIIEISTGRQTVIERTDEFNVLDPLTAPGVTNVCINNIGDADFNDAPAGAVTINRDSFDSSDAEFTSRLGQKVNWLFKAGGDFSDVYFHRNEVQGGSQAVGFYGSGAKPILRPPLDTTNGNAINFMEAPFGSNSPSEVFDLRMWGVRFQGNVDVTQDSGSNSAWASTVSRNNSETNVLLYDVEVDGFADAIVYFGNTTETDSAAGNACHTCLCEATLTNWIGQYPVFASYGAPGSTSGMIAIEMFRPPNSFTNDAEMRGPVRFNHNDRLCIRSVNTQSNNHGGRRFNGDGSIKYLDAPTNTIEDRAPSNSGIKLANSPVRDGSIVTMMYSNTEGMLNVLDFGSNSFQGQPTWPTPTLGRPSVQNVRVMSCTGVGSLSTQQFVTYGVTGWVVEDTLLIMPNAPYRGYGGRFGFAAFGITNTGSGASAKVMATPNYFRRVTFVYDRVDNNGADPSKFFDGAFNTPIEESCIWVGSWNGIAADAYDPLVDTVLWSPKSDGERPLELPANNVDGTTASPANSVRLPVPEPTSAAYQTGAYGSGHRGHDALLRADPPNLGAV